MIGVNRLVHFLPTQPSRVQDGFTATAIKKIFLEYASLIDAANAERELSGRQFGSNVVKVTFFDEKDYASRNLR
jgi:hypothetical protein